MAANPSIDRKLPALTSGLVILTAFALVTTAHVNLDRALVESAKERLLTTARVAAQRIVRPAPRITDPTLRAADDAVPIVVATASPTWNRARSLLLAGASDYIRKTSDRATLLRTLQPLLLRPQEGHEPVLPLLSGGEDRVLVGRHQLLEPGILEANVVQDPPIVEDVPLE